MSSIKIKTAEEIANTFDFSVMTDVLPGILDAMKEYAEQFIDLAAEEAYCNCSIDWNDPYDYSAGHNGIKGELQKESILELKQLIK